ncbi:LysR family transcriptional regulator [Vibrio mexicanus]|uniref:LysR family transcriptional regulator n=1 Tax=Vibrio mexicanus TaxID=1004326 RepID=UPI00063C3AE7|nr:LysR family transcriptional regulator [Vibrio mexicanus]
MKFNGFDLNLFKAFIKVIETGSYAAAAEVLEISPPAVSLAMGRLQKALGKELFIRGNSVIQPTSTALALYDNVRGEYLALERVVNAFEEFTPDSSAFHFTLSVPEELNPTLLKYLPLESNQQLTFSLVEQALDEDSAISGLRSRRVDLAVDSHLLEDFGLESELLFEDEIVIVVSNHNSQIGSTMTLEQYQELPQAVLNVRRNNKRALEMFLDSPVKIERNVAHEASSLVTSMLVASSTELFCHTTRRLANQYKDALSLRVLEVPIELKKIPFYMYWHKSNSSIASHQWCRKRLKQIIDSSVAH